MRAPASRSFATIALVAAVYPACMRRAQPPSTSHPTTARTTWMCGGQPADFSACYSAQSVPRISFCLSGAGSDYVYEGLRGTHRFDFVTPDRALAALYRTLRERGVHDVRAQPIQMTDTSSSALVVRASGGTYTMSCQIDVECPSCVTFSEDCARVVAPMFDALRDVVSSLYIPVTFVADGSLAGNHVGVNWDVPAKDQMPFHLSGEIGINGTSFLEEVLPGRYPRLIQLDRGLTLEHLLVITRPTTVTLRVDPSGCLPLMIEVKTAQTEQPETWTGPCTKIEYDTAD